MQNIGSILPDFLKRIAHDEELCLIFLAELWPQMVGSQLARRTRPVFLKRKRLRVGVASESWLRELEGLEPGMIESVNQFWRCRLIEQIEFESRPIN